MNDCNTRQSGKHPKGIKHIIISGIDGFSQDSLRNAKIPVIDKMIANVQ
jgi:hypothetical protein